MAFDAFLKIAEIPGESLDNQFKGQIEIMAFSFGASMPANVTQSGLGAGKVQLSDFTISKGVDKASAKFFAATCVGTHLQSVVFSKRKAGGGTTGGYVYLTFTLTDALVTSLHISGSGDTATESVSFAFSKIAVEYFQQQASGSVGSTGSQSWSVVTNSNA